MRIRGSVLATGALALAMALPGTALGAPPDVTPPSAPVLTVSYLAPPTSFVVGRGTNVGVSVLEGHGNGVNTFTVEAVDGSGNVSALSNQLPLTITGCP